MAVSLLQLLQSAAVQAIQFQACMILCVAIIGWTLSGLRRRREACRLTAARYTDVLRYRAAAAVSPGAPQLQQHKQQQQGSQQQQEQQRQPGAQQRTKAHRHSKVFKSQLSCWQGDAERSKSTSASASSSSSSSNAWPPLAVVCPVKGCRPHSILNWASQLAAAYDGPRVFVFVVEASTDPAASALADLMQQQGAISCLQQRTTHLNGNSSRKRCHQQQQQQQEEGQSDREPSSQPLLQLLQDNSSNGQGTAEVPRLQQQQQQQQQQQWGRHECFQLQQVPHAVLEVWQQRDPSKLVMLVQSGLAATCSQKIHNILHGIEAALPILKQLQHCHPHQQQQQQQQCQQQPDKSAALPTREYNIQADAAAATDQLSSLAAAKEAAEKPYAASQEANSARSPCQHVPVCALTAAAPPAASAAGGGSSASEATTSGALGVQVLQEGSCNGPAAAAAAAAAKQGGQRQQPSKVAAAAAGDAEAAGGGYVCVLDDDVLLHPLSLMQLVDELEADTSLFMLTGYPFDIVADPAESSDSNGASISNSKPSCTVFGRLLSYAGAAYHLPLTIGFSIADKGDFVWGGVMMLRVSSLMQSFPQPAAAKTAATTAATRAAAAPPSGGVFNEADPASATAARLTVAGTSSSSGGDGCQEAAPVAAAAAQGQGQQAHNILQVWRHGGYSDDLLLAGFCVANKLTIGLPASALFPQLLPASSTWKQYWNYLRRQLFVLDTYYSNHNRRINHTMMLLHSYGSAVFTVAVLATVLQLLMFTALIAAALGCSILGHMSRLESSIGSRRASGLMAWVLDWQPEVMAVVAAAAGRAHRQLCRMNSSCSYLNVDHAAVQQAPELHKPYDQASLSGGDMLQAAASAGLSHWHCLWQLLWMCCSPGTCAFVACVLMSQAAIGFMSRQCLRLFRLLSPHASAQVLRPRISWAYLWAGWVLEHAVLPACMMYTYCCDRITWSGISYHKKGGKVVRVVHPKGSSTL